MKRGNALIVDKEGNYKIEEFIEPKENKACSFERIYFSRGNDPEIYNERKTLGKLLIPKILESINYDIKNTIFSYIPNTSETCFYGMIDGLKNHINSLKNDVFINNKSFKESKK